jgi:hypothetical protein
MRRNPEPVSSEIDFNGTLCGSRVAGTFPEATTRRRPAAPVLTT